MLFAAIQTKRALSIARSVSPRANSTGGSMLPRRCRQLFGVGIIGAMVWLAPADRVDGERGRVQHDDPTHP